MFIPEGTPTRSRTIQGDAYEAAGYPDFSFDIPRPFVPEDFSSIAEKYSVSATGLANGMNQLLAENIRNNFAKRVKDAGDSPDVEKLQAELDTYIGEYEFGVRRSGGGRAGNPVEKEAMEIARNKVKSALQEKGHKLSDISSARITELATEALAKHPEWTKAAETVVKQREAVADIQLEELS